MRGVGLITLILLACTAFVLSLAKQGESSLRAAGNGANAQHFSPQRIAQDLAQFDSLGIHRTGSQGDIATTAWLEQELDSLGYSVERQAFTVATWNIRESRLSLGEETLEVFPQFPVLPTPEIGISGPLSLWAPDRRGDHAGRILLLDTRFEEHRGTLARPELYERLVAASGSGASAIVLITRAKCGRYQLLNAPQDLPPWKIPIVLAGENDAKRLLRAADAGLVVQLHIDATAEQKTAYNLTATIGPEREPAVVISTPQSGWFTSTAERGSGVAAFLALARWAAGRNEHFQFLANSGHERGYAGAHAALKSALPPERVAFWLHIGSNVGAVGPAPGYEVVKTRYVMGSGWLTPGLWSVFRPQAGMVAWPVPLQFGLAGGELRAYHEAGYSPVAGIFGSSPWHHCPNDRLAQASVDATRDVAVAFAALISKMFPEN